MQKVTEEKLEQLARELKIDINKLSCIEIPQEDYCSFTSWMGIPVSHSDVNHIMFFSHVSLEG